MDQDEVLSGGFIHVTSIVSAYIHTFVMVSYLAACMF